MPDQALAQIMASGKTQTSAIILGALVKGRGRPLNLLPNRKIPNPHFPHAVVHIGHETFNQPLRQALIHHPARPKSFESEKEM